MICIAWRSAQLFNLELGTWVNQAGTTISIEVLSKAFHQFNPKMQEDHRRLVTEIKKKVGNDLTIIALFVCISLFAPELSTEGYRVIVSNLQDKYSLLLKHYLEANYDWAEAVDKLSVLTRLAFEAKVHTDENSKAFMTCNASHVDPLLLEVFNLQ